MRSFFLISAFLLTACAGPAFAADHPHMKTSEKSESENSDFARKLKERLSAYDMIDTEAGDNKTTEKKLRIYQFKSGDEIREKSREQEK